MKVLLISPKVKTMGLESFASGYTIGSGILYIAAAARDSAHDVAVELGNEANIIHLIKKHSPDIVGLTCLTVSYPTARAMINAIKAYNPNILTIMGGLHATFMTRDVFSECSPDYVLRGEGEAAFPLLLDHIGSGNKYPRIEGVAFRKGTEILNIDSFALLENIDALPRITRDLIPNGVKNFSLPISSSRGCPFRCSFCCTSAFHRGMWRKRNIETILDEIEACIEGHFKCFSFGDDNLTVDTERVKEICKGLKERGLDNLKWRCMSRVDSICRDPAMVEKMVDAGCTTMSLGIESGVQEIIDTYKKGITLEHVREAVKIMNDSSIFHQWFVIIGSGNEYDHPKYIIKNIDFMKNIEFDLMQISILTPFPGTELYNNLRKENRLLHRTWEKYDGAHCVYQPLHMTPQQIEEYFVEAYKTVYLSRGFGLFKTAWKGVKALSFVTPTLIAKTAEYGAHIILRNESFYEFLE